MKKPQLPDSRRLRKVPRKLWRFLGDNWWPILSSVIVLGVIAILLGFKLVGLTGHRLSPAEYIYAQHLVQRDFGARAIVQNPVDLPFKLLLYGLEKARVTNWVALRAISVAFGGAAIGSFYLIVKNWHTRRVAILATALFASAAWTLHISRLATPEVLLMVPTVLILCATWLEISYKRKWILTLCLVAAMLLVYIPGMIFFVAAGVTWQSKHLYRELRDTSIWFAVPWLLLAIILLLPLFWMLATAPHNLLSLLGLPSHLPTPKQYLLNVIHVPINLFIHGPADPMRWLGRLPLLDLFEGVMFALGVYAYAFRFRLNRTKLLAGTSLAGTLLIGLGGGVTISFLMPFVYIVIAGGIALMLQQWATVFPRNPFAKTLATCLMCTVVLLSAFYNLNHYFIAWPNAPATRHVFTERQ